MCVVWAISTLPTLHPVRGSGGGQTGDSPGSGLWSLLGQPERLHQPGQESDGLAMHSVPFAFILLTLL